MNPNVDAVERIAARLPSVPLLLSCEHASERLPAGWRWSEGDKRLVGTHWSYDIGAAELTRELCRAVGCGAVMARFSRLLIDPNRPLESDTLFRTHAEGVSVDLNQQIDADERERRLPYWREYHAALANAAAASDGVLFAIHSFTPLCEGEPRELGIGVLFEREDQLGQQLADWLAPLDVPVALNEPYSGKAGLIYSAQHHADASGMRALEIEVRQDLCADRDFRAQLVDRLAAMPWPRG